MKEFEDVKEKDTWKGEIWVKGSQVIQKSGNLL